MSFGNLKWGKLIFPTIFMITVNLQAENPSKVLTSINENIHLIHKAANLLDVNPHILASIITAERTLNVDWKDAALDIPLAQSGYNSSIGFCQVKMKTAYWIEVQLSDSTSEFYPGKQYQNLLPLSKSPREIIRNLQNDSLNIIYAAAYLKIIQHYWQKAGFPIDSRPDILGTLYSTGMFLPNGEIRIPNKNPKANLFGKKVKEAYRLFIDL